MLCAYACTLCEKNETQMFAQKFSLFSTVIVSLVYIADIYQEDFVCERLGVLVCVCRYGNEFDIRKRYIFVRVSWSYLLFVRCEFSAKFIPSHFSAFIHTIYGNLVFMKY